MVGPSVRQEFTAEGLSGCSAGRHKYKEKRAQKRAEVPAAQEGEENESPEGGRLLNNEPNVKIWTRDGYSGSGIRHRGLA